MSVEVQVLMLAAIIGLLIVWTPPARAQGPKPQPGDEVCPMCSRALITAHHHGVAIFSRPKGPRPRPTPPGPQG